MSPLKSPNFSTGIDDQQLPKELNSIPWLGFHSGIVTLELRWVSQVILNRAFEKKSHNTKHGESNENPHTTGCQLKMQDNPQTSGWSAGHSERSFLDPSQICHHNLNNNASHALLSALLVTVMFR